MAQQPIEAVNDESHLWPKSLLLNQAIAAGLACCKYDHHRPMHAPIFVSHFNL